MIRSFADRNTELFFYGERIRKFESCEVLARRKLIVLDNTRSLEDLRKPAGNRLEALKGDRRGQYSIRVNDRYRICFVWRGSEAFEVQLVDYHWE